MFISAILTQSRIINRRTNVILLRLFRIGTAIVIFYPLIRDRVLRTIDYDCKFLPDKNPEFVIAMAFVGHHVPCVVIVVCYAWVFYEIRKLIKTRPQDRAEQTTVTRTKPSCSVIYVKEAGTVTRMDNEPTEGKQQQGKNVI